jgi:hypothetical protein
MSRDPIWGYPYAVREARSMSDFQKRHYEAIAREIRLTRTTRDTGKAVKREIAIRLADLFEKDNKNFNREMFLHASGVYDG